MLTLDALWGVYWPSAFPHDSRGWWKSFPLLEFQLKQCSSQWTCCAVVVLFIGLSQACHGMCHELGTDFQAGLPAAPQVFGLYAH